MSMSVPSVFVDVVVVAAVAAVVAVVVVVVADVGVAFAGGVDAEDA